MRAHLNVATLATATAAVLAVTAPGAAAAPVQFPEDISYHPLRCAGTPMTDKYRDQPGFTDDGDVVGTVTAPAALRAADAQYLYLRIRLDGDPAPTQTPHPASWGVELDLDGDPTTYELLMFVDGTAGKNVVELFTNHTVTLPNDPDDPADQPAVASYPFADNARSVMAMGAPTGSNPDFYLDFALPWSDLQAAGLDRTTPHRVWVASSTAADGLNGDFACHDGAGGAAHLDVADSDAAPIDPANDPDGNGSGSGSDGTGTGRLEGGGGCAASGGATTWLFALAIVGWITRVQRRATCRVLRLSQR